MDRHMSTKFAPSRGRLDQWVSNTKTAEPIETPFRGLTHACLHARNNVLVGRAHWRHLVNTTKPPVVPPKTQQRVQVRQRVGLHYATTSIRLSAAEAFECHIKFPPCDAAFRQS